MEALTATDLVGVLGSLIIGGAYLAVTRNLVSGNGLPFNLANLTGSVLILFSLYFRPNAGAILIEVIWIGVAVSALVSWFLRR